MQEGQRCEKDGCTEERAHREIEEDAGEVDLKIIIPVFAASHVNMRLVWNVGIHMVCSGGHTNACSQDCMHLSAT